MYGINIVVLPENVQEGTRGRAVFVPFTQGYSSLHTASTKTIVGSLFYKYAILPLDLEVKGSINRLKSDQGCFVP